MTRALNGIRNMLQPLMIQVAVAAVSFAFVGGYAAIALNLSFLSPISETIQDFSITDKYYQMMPAETSHSVTIVDLTELYGRDEIVCTIEDIESCHPAVIGMDAVFEGEKTEQREADDALRKVAKEYGNIIFSYKLLEEQDSETGYTRAVRSFFAEEMTVHEGVTNMPRKLYGGMKRTLQQGWLLNGELRPSFVTEVVNKYAGETVSHAEDGNLDINFAPTDFDVIKPCAVLENRELIEGRIVLFGTMADENDMHYTPLGKMPGVKLLAYGAQTLLEQKEIRRLPLGITIVLSILLVITANLLQTAYLRWTTTSGNPFVHHVMGSAYVLGLVTFAFIVVLMYVTFICFCVYHVCIDLEWAIAAMAFLATSRSFLAAVGAYYQLWKHKSQIKK